MTVYLSKTYAICAWLWRWEIWYGQRLLQCGVAANKREAERCVEGFARKERGKRS